MTNDSKFIIQNLMEHSGFRKYFANTSWLFLGRFFQMGIAFIVGVWVVRYLGPAKFGLLSFARSYAGLFMAIATLGLDGIVIRELVKDESKRDVLLGTSFILKLVGAVIALFLIISTIYFTSANSLTRLLVIIVSASLIFQAFNVIDLYFQSKVISKFSVAAQMISASLSALLKIYLILSKESVIYFAATGIFDMFTIGAGYVYFYVKSNHLSLGKWRFDWHYAKSLLKDSWPLLFSGIAVGIYMKIDQVMIKYMLDNRAVGLYSAAVKLCEVWYFIPVLISSSLFPAIINAKKVSEELYYKRLQRLYDLMVWMAIAIALPMTFLSGWIVNILYGTAYSGAGKVLMIYIWAGVFVSLGIVKGKWQINENLTKFHLYGALAGALTNIFLNWIFIPWIGNQGAAMATLISQCVSAYLINFFFKELKGQIKFMNQTINLTRIINSI